MPWTRMYAAMAGAAAVAVAVVGIWMYGKAQYRAGVQVEAARHTLAMAQASAAAEQAARSEEARRAAEIEEIQRHAQSEILAAQLDADAAADTAGRLRAELARLRANRTTGDPVATVRGPPGPDALDLLAELFSGADGRAGALAAIADRSRAAGLACERAYDAMRSGHAN